MREYRINWGKFLFIRWIIVSWILQAVHVLDKSERLFRVMFEIVLLIPMLVFYFLNVFSCITVLVYTILIHTSFYLFNSTWLVGYREVNRNFQGKGIQSIMDFSNYLKKDIENCDYNAVLLYGSLSRRQYHDRSDLDIRIIRSSKNKYKLFFKAIKYRAIGIWKYKIPIDLKIVDTMHYLKKEMRNDELPIVIAKKESFQIFNEGDSFQSLEDNPNKYLK